MSTKTNAREGSDTTTEGSDTTNTASDTTDVDTLFTMADTIRDDGLYDVSVTDWNRDADQYVVVEYETPFGEIETERLTWPLKPDQNNEFVRLCMVALDLDDPVDAIARANVLKRGHDEWNPTEHTVPAEVTRDVADRIHWSLEPDRSTPGPRWKQASQQLVRTIYPNHLTWSRAIVVLMLAPMGLMVWMMDSIEQQFEPEFRTELGIFSFIGIFIYLVSILSIFVLL